MCITMATPSGTKSFNCKTSSSLLLPEKKPETISRTWVYRVYQRITNCVMGIVLAPRCPISIDGISIDPEPNWNFHSLVSEIESVEKKLNAFSKFPQSITNTTSRMGRSRGGFVMCVSEDDMESDDEFEEEEDHSQICTAGKRFACDELYLSDESDDDLTMNLCI
ncbi:unnamed protein product [Arabidopsis lyrata]|nr:unnamed protein product [Arabidopsis lyrata]